MELTTRPTQTCKMTMDWYYGWLAMITAVLFTSATRWGQDISQVADDRVFASPEECVTSLAKRRRRWSGTRRQRSSNRALMNGLQRKAVRENHLRNSVTQCRRRYTISRESVRPQRNISPRKLLQPTLNGYERRGQSHARCGVSRAFSAKQHRSTFVKEDPRKEINFFPVETRKILGQRQPVHQPDVRPSTHATEYAHCGRKRQLLYDRTRMVTNRKRFHV